MLRLMTPFLAPLIVLACSPKEGLEFPQTTASSPDALNEPCYTHNKEVCPGYAVCCVKKGTCPDTISSNDKYYEGGCWSAKSSKGSLRDGCAKQGECLQTYIEYSKGGTSPKGNSYEPVELPKATKDKHKEGAGDCSAPPTAGSSGLGMTTLIIIIIVAVLVLAVFGLSCYCYIKRRRQLNPPGNKA
jgi:hypothetical protein